MDSELTSNRKLTKKEKKALAFRSNKGKGKKAKEGGDDEQLAVPEGEELNDDASVADADQEDEKKKKDKTKRKRDDDDDREAAGEEDKGEEGSDEAPKKKKRQRGKKQSQRNKEAAAAGVSKLLLFVGNLPYKVTTEQIKAHFKPCGEEPQVRLLTPKVKPTEAEVAEEAKAVKSKGCAFIEFTSPLALQSALRLHESELSGRKINVELTAGGGGNSQQRKKKLEDKRKMMQKEREKVALNRKKKDIEAGKLNPDGTRLWGAPKQAKPTTETRGPAQAAVESSQGDIVTKNEGDTASPEKKVKKLRDRRLKKDDTAAAASGGKRKAFKPSVSGANSIRLGV